MFCSKCGAVLTEGQNFCPKCGERVTASGISEKKNLYVSGITECSEKNQLMLNVPGRGLYFIANGKKMCFLEEGSNTAAVLSQKDTTLKYCGLGYYDGYIYYWMESQNRRSNLYGMRLNRLDVNTNQSEAVWESDEDLFSYYRLDDNPLKARAILYRGSYYLLNYMEQKIMRVDLPTGEWENLPVPNMMRHIPLYEWIQPKGIINLKNKESNFGMRFTGLDIVNGQIYLSLEDLMVFTLRYPVDNPDQITYLPLGAATAIQNNRMGGMLTSFGNRIFSCPGIKFGNTELCLFEINTEGNLIRMISEFGNKVTLLYKGGLWWRMGNIFYIGNLAIDLLRRKFHGLHPLLFDQGVYKDNVFGEVADFFPAMDGGVYLLTNIGLYHVPLDWEDQCKRVGDQEKYRVLSLNKL